MTTGVCPLCKCTDAGAVVRAGFNLTGASQKTWSVVECRNCGMRYVDPMPNDEELAFCYAGDYPAYAPAQEHSGDSRRQASIARRFQRVAELRYRFLRDHIPDFTARGPVLDVGCGNGAFIAEVLSRTGLECWGLDIEAAPKPELPTSRSLRFVKGDLQTVRLPSSHFGLITFWHSLEHEADPVAMLKSASSLLRPGGAIVAEVPNSAGLIAGICGSSWLGWDLPRHRVHFASATLHKTARLAGLCNIRVKHHYTLNPICLSPILASMSLWRQERRGHKRFKLPNYCRWDKAERFLKVVNAFERLLRGNGLVLIAQADSMRVHRNAA